MPAGFSSSDKSDLIQAERDVQARIGELDIDFVSLSAVSNIFRAATTVRNHMERTVLSKADLSFTAFVVLWVLWIWGEQEARHVASESGISRGTLTGVVSTLESRSLVARRTHPDDRRSVLVRATREGETLMRKLFPLFNAQETNVSSRLSTRQKRDLADALRVIQRTVESFD